MICVLSKKEPEDHPGKIKNDYNIFDYEKDDPEGEKRLNNKTVYDKLLNLLINDEVMM